MTVLGGTILHFLYGLTKESVLVAPFSAVNESIWEHMKLMYFPLFVFALIQSRFSPYASLAQAEAHSDKTGRNHGGQRNQHIQNFVFALIPSFHTSTAYLMITYGYCSRLMLCGS